MLGTLVLGACLSSEPLPVPRAPELAGTWNVQVNVSAGPEDQCLLRGTLDFTQAGSTVSGQAQAYSGSCLAISGPLTNLSVGDSLISMHAGACTFTGIFQPLTPDTLSGTAVCQNTFGTWSGRWDAARTGAVASVTIFPRTAGIVTGASHVIAATVRDAAGHVLYGKAVTWSSTNGAIVSVVPGSNNTATITGAGTGSATIGAVAPSPGIQIAASESVAVALPAFTDIDAGDYTSCGLAATTGTIWCWGVTDFSSSPFFTGVTSPVMVSAPGYVQVSVGGTHICALRANGDAYCAGRNNAGQLGTGDTTSGTAFRPVTGGHTFAKIVAGYNYSCGVTTGHAAYCWGSNQSGALGSADSLSSIVPKAVSGGLVVQDIDAFADHACAITTTSTAYCWGSNAWGELGNSTTSSTPTRQPQLVAGNLAVAAVAPGGIHTCALAGTTVYCWGNGAFGQIGNGTNTVTNVAPVAVSGTWSLVRSSYNSSCALASPGGAASCWGANNIGQLGTGAASSGVNSPQPVGGGLAFTKLALGGSHACGLTTAGAAWCWGYNIYGQLGDATTTQRDAPVKVFGQP